MTDIYTAENIARSRARATMIRQMATRENLGQNWFEIADEIDAYANRREALGWDFSKVWHEGWNTGERYGYWAERGGDDDIEDLAVAVNPYTASPTN